MCKKPLRLRVLTRFMRVFFFLLYHHLAWLYDFVAATVSLGMWATWIEDVLPHLTGLKVLELGYGTGNLQIRLHQQGFMAIGIDESSAMGKIAQAKAHKYHQPVRLVCGVAQRIPFSSHYFDHVVTTFPTNYIFDPQTLREVAHVLVPGGTLVVLPLVWITGKSWPHRIVASLFRRTGQTPTLDEMTLAPFQRAGLQAQWIQTPHKSWSSAIVLAKKPETG